MKMNELTFNQKILCHRNLIFNFILKKTNKDYDLTEDIVQTAFIKAFNYVKDNYESPTNYRSWLCTIALNCLIDYKKNKKNNYIYYNDLTHDQTIEYEIQDSFDFDKHLDYIVYKKAIDEGLKNLLIEKPELYYTFIKSFDCVDYKEIAETDNIPVNTVKTKVFRAKKFMHKYLENV